MAMSRAGAVLNVCLWAIGLMHVFRPRVVQRFYLRFHPRATANAKRLLQPVHIRRAGVFLLIVITVITYLAVTTP